MSGVTRSLVPEGDLFMRTTVSLGFSARHPWILGGLLGAFALSSCDCAGDRLVIVDPVQSQTLAASDDRDTTLGGLQYDVNVDVTGLRIGELITVYAGSDPDTLLEEGLAATGVNEPDGHASVRVTLQNGDLYLMACAREHCAVRSPRRKVVVTGSQGSCPLVQFTSPAATGSGTITLPASSDELTTDGACGAAFGVTVRARVQVDDGTTVRLFADGIPTDHATVTDHIADFGIVTLGVRGTDTTQLHIEVDGEPDTCAAPLDHPIAVACGGPTCRLESPIDGLYLNGTLDENTTKPGLDVNLSLDGPVTGVGRNYVLRDDTSSAVLGTVAATSASGKSVANFLSIPLAEGLVRLGGECTDGSATTRAAIAEYTVDSVACTANLTAPMDGEILTATDDTDLDLSNGIQANASMDVSGSGCVDFRLAPCAALTATEFTELTGTSASDGVTFGSSGTQTLCGEVRDLAGNLGQDTISVGVVASGTPAVQIASPVDTSRINKNGGLYLGVQYVADAVPASSSCEVRVDVDCSAIGTAVSLVVDGVVSGAPMANCATNAQSALGGRATFTNVSFAAGTTTAHTLVATQNDGGLVGTSPMVGIATDCLAPTLSVTSPTCGSSLGTADDVAATPGIQAPVTIGSPNTPQVDVTVTVTTSSGVSSSTTSLASSLPPNATAHTFSSVNFGGAGTVMLAASALDSFGNTAVTSACSIVVTDLPSIDLTPLAKTTFNTADLATDCSSGNSSLDLTIAGTTDATVGSNVTLQIGVGAPIMVTVQAGGTFTGCVPAPEGTSQVNATVNDTVGSDGISGMASAVPITIVVATTPLTTAIDPVTVTITDRRAGSASLSFTAVADGSMAALTSYQLRCGDATIVTEADWTAASVVTIGAATPKNPGTADSVTATGFLTGTASPCMLRGLDAGGNLTPLPTATGQITIEPKFLVMEYPGTVTQGSMGVMGMRAVGDVNDDNLADFIVSGESSAYLFLGQAGGSLPVLATTFVRTPSSRFFSVVARGIGDFNADGIDDIVVGDPINPAINFAGEVYVYYGRASWPASVTADSATCTASFCMRGPAGSRLGFDVMGLGNFDGASGADMAVAASMSGRVYVVSGRNDIPAGTNYVIGTNDPLGFSIVSPGAPGTFGWTLGAPGNIVGSANTDLVIGHTGSYPMANLGPAILYRVAGRALGGGSGFTTISGASEIVQITTDMTLISSFATNDYRSIPFGDFDGDSLPDLFAFTYGNASISSGTWLMYGSAAANYPFSGSTRLIAGSGTKGDGYYGSATSFPLDPNFGHLGDLNNDGRDEYGAGTITVTDDGNFSVGLVYGSATRLSGTYAAKQHPRNTAVLAPAVEAYPAVNGPLWHIGFPGDVVRDTTTSYRDIVICDPGTGTPFVFGDTGRIFVLY